MAVGTAITGFSHLPAGADLSTATNQFRFVKTLNETIVLCNAAGETPDGILANTPMQNEAAIVVFSGVMKVRFGATVAADALVATAADGEAVTATTGDFIRGKAIEGGAAGEYGNILLVPQGTMA